MADDDNAKPAEPQIVEVIPESDGGMHLAKPEKTCRDKLWPAIDPAPSVSS